MSTKNRINLEVDQHSRVAIKDVISLLKGLRSDAVIKIVQSSDLTTESHKLNSNVELVKKPQDNISTQDSFKKSPLVKGNTMLPQIRELNEIAGLLRSMDMQQTQTSS